jgi:PAS domain S-box-containing protein
MIGIHKNAEEAFEEKARLLDLSNDAILTRDASDRITFWSKGATDMYGFSREEAIGRVSHDLLRTEFPEPLESIKEKLLQDGQWAGELRHTCATGARKTVSTRWVVDRDASGSMRSVLESNRDITAQKRTEQALRESEQLYQAATDASPIMIWMSGTDTLCYYFNKGWLDFVGRTLEQEAGKGWAENVHPDDFDRCLQVYVSNFDARRPFEMEYRLRHHSKQYRWIFDRAVPRYKPDGTFEGYVGGCLDIHDRKVVAEKIRIADESLRLIKAQDEERRRIAREFHDSAGQTLTVLGLSLAQLVQKAEMIAPELAKEGKEIEEVVQQLHREIRTTSYLLHPPLLDEAGVNPSLSWYVQGVAERSGMAIDLNISKDFGRLPAEMELAIFRIVQECLTNIHRHAASKTARIRVARASTSVYIEVRDEGKGISPERLAEIRSRGSGVGIGGIRERLRRFHGEMKIESNSSGTTVSATIPIPSEALKRLEGRSAIDDRDVCQHNLLLCQCAGTHHSCKDRKDFDPEL